MKNHLSYKSIFCGVVLKHRFQCNKKNNENPYNSISPKTACLDIISYLGVEDFGFHASPI